jgi:hypothetical protein
MSSIMYQAVKTSRQLLVILANEINTLAKKNLIIHRLQVTTTAKLILNTAVVVPALQIQTL